MTDHEDTAACLREIDELAAFRICKRKGLLDESILAGLKNSPRQREVRLRWSSDDNPGRRRGKDRFRIGDDLTPWCGCGPFYAALLGRITYQLKRAELMKIAYKVLAPISATEDCNCRRHIVSPRSSPLPPQMPDQRPQP
jgi:hypothetical protein